MSEQKMQEAKANLAFSQSLLDNLRKPPMDEESSIESPQETMEAPQEEAQVASQQEQPEKPDTEIEEKGEAGLLSAFMGEIRSLFKGKEDEERKTQQLVEKHNKDMEEIKSGLSDILNG